MVSSHDLIGRTLGEYVVLAALGGGSFGTVYRAIRPRSGAIVAIKLLHRAITDAESQRVITEARAAAGVSHPNVVQVYDLGLTSDRRPYIVMQYLEGVPLARHTGAPLPIDQVTSIAKDVLRGLGAAHAKGVVHRDLKPDNIFVTAQGRAAIVDFGLAKLVADPKAPHLTVTGEALGTPHYMAPEQIRGKPVDGRADLYAVACVLHTLLAGRPPFDAPTTFQLFDAHLHQAPPHVATLRPDTPAPLAAAIWRALAKEPDQRFPDARSMLYAIQGRRRRRTWPLVAVNAAAAAAIAGLIVLAVTREDHPAPATAAPAPVAIPPAEPAEPVLRPQLEQALAAMRTSLENYHYTRANLPQMLCAFEDSARAMRSAPAEYRAYIRRARAMFAARLPDVDAKTECAKH